MTSVIDPDYKKYLLPKRLVFFDLDGTIIPSTNAAGRRVAISISCYEQVLIFAKKHLQLTALPALTEDKCSEWYRSHGGPKGLIKRILQETPVTDEIKDCLSDYFNGLFTRRLTKYLRDDLEYDSVPEAHIQFLAEFASISSMVLVSYRYQSQFDFLNSVDKLGLGRNGIFGPHNAFAVGAPGTSSDGSKARFVGAMWRNEIRAQRRLTAANGKTFPPVVIGDSIRDVHFAVDIGGIFFGVSETGEDSRTTLVAEIKEQADKLNLNTRSRVFDSLASPELQQRLVEESEQYRSALGSLKN